MRIATEITEGLQYWLCMLGIPINGSASIFCDNMSVVMIITQPESTLKKKHNAIAYYRVAWVVSNCFILTNILITTWFSSQRFFRMTMAGSWNKWWKERSRYITIVDHGFTLRGLIWITCVGLLLSKRECMSVDRRTKLVSSHKVTFQRYMMLMYCICFYKLKTIPDTKYGQICATDRYCNRSF